MIRAVGPLGHTKWQMVVPGGELAGDTFALADGGVVVSTGGAIVRLPHPDGGPAWRFPADVAAMGRTPDGNIIALVNTAHSADRELLSLAGDSGAVPWRHALPRSPGGVSLNLYCDSNWHVFGDDGPAAASALTIDEHGTTYLYLKTSYAFSDSAAGGQCGVHAIAKTGDLSLMSVTESGSASVTRRRRFPGCRSTWISAPASRSQCQWVCERAWAGRDGRSPLQRFAANARSGGPIGAHASTNASTCPSDDASSPRRE